MRKRLAIWLIIFLLSIFTQSFWENIFPWVEGSFFVLIFLVFFSIFSQVDEKCLLKIFLGSGFIIDIMFFYPLGFHALAFLATFAFFLFFSKKVLSFDRDKPFMSGILLVMATLTFEYLIENVMEKALSLLQGGYSPGVRLSVFLWNIIFAVLVYFIFYPIFRKISEKLSFREMSLVIKR